MKRTRPYGITLLAAWQWRGSAWGTLVLPKGGGRQFLRRRAGKRTTPRVGAGNVQLRGSLQPASDAYTQRVDVALCSLCRGRCGRHAQFRARHAPEGNEPPRCGRLGHWRKWTCACCAREASWPAVFAALVTRTRRAMGSGVREHRGGGAALEGGTTAMEQVENFVDRTANASPWSMSFLGPSPLSWDRFTGKGVLRRCPIFSRHGRERPWPAENGLSLSPSLPLRSSGGRDRCRSLTVAFLWPCGSRAFGVGARCARRPLAAAAAATLFGSAAGKVVIDAMKRAPFSAPVGSTGRSTTSFAHTHRRASVCNAYVSQSGGWVQQPA